MDIYNQRREKIEREQKALFSNKNIKIPQASGWFDRYIFPVVTPAHIPLNWRYDFNPDSNPYFLERIGVNATFNAGAIRWQGKYILMVRVEGVDRKSYFAIAESATGIDGFVFKSTPVVIPQLSEPDTNVYDMRLTAHEDGFIYGIFCTERRDSSAPIGDQSMAVAQCGIIRSRDLINWERLADLKTSSPQQRNVVLHESFINGKYAFYTRPQDGFIESGTGGGIGFGLSDSIENASIRSESILDGKKYHTVYEAKNGLGPGPLKTAKGWLHLAHGVRNTAAGLRYVLYLFLTDINDPSRILFKPAGYFLAPEGEERIGDVSNVVFSNGWIMNEDGKIFIYYASSDTRLHVATTSLEVLLDYVINTPPDGLSSDASVQSVLSLIEKNEVGVTV